VKLYISFVFGVNPDPIWDYGILGDTAADEINYSLGKISFLNILGEIVFKSAKLCKGVLRLFKIEFARCVLN